LQKNLEEEWVRSGQELLKGFSPDNVLSLVPKIFAESDFQISTSFKETSLALPDSIFDLSLAEGATLCFGLHGREGQLSIPSPIALQGFAATLWFLSQPLDKVVTDEAGNVGVSSPCFDKALKDITPEVMDSPLGDLFPRRKVGPVSLEAFLRFVEKFLQEKPVSGPPAPVSPMQGMIDHLDRMAISALIYRTPQDRPLGDLFSWDGGVCHASAASVYAVLNVPLLKENFHKRRYETFDFQGVEALSVHWPQFPLQELLPEGGPKVLSGDVSLDVQGSAKAESIEILLTFRQSKLVWEKIFGAEPVELAGGLRIVLHKGGVVTLEPRELRVQMSVFPSARYPLFSLAGTLDGPVVLHREADGSFQVRSSKLSFKDFQLAIREGSPLSLDGLGRILSGKIGGLLTLNYDAGHPFQNFTPSFDLKGDLEFSPQDSKKITKVTLQDLHTQGALSFARSGEKFYPNLSFSSFDLETNLSLFRGSKEVIGAESLRLRSRGGERKELGKEIQQNATLILDADGIYAGQFAWDPELSLEVRTHQGPEGFSLAAQGNFNLTSIEPKKKLSDDATILPPFTDISLPVSISTDGESLLWQIEMKRRQVVGPVAIDGELKIVGEDDRFKITTPTPLTIRVNDREAARGLVLKGSRDEKKTAFSLQAASLADRFRGGIWFQPVGDRISGAYQFSPLEKALPKGKDFALAEAQVRGSFSTPDFEQMVEKPRIYLKGTGEARLLGDVSGDLKTEYALTVLYQPTVQRETRKGPREFPANYQLVFSNKGESRLEIGPLLTRDGKELLKGNSKLKGTLILTPHKGEVVLGGSRVGLSDGIFFYGGKPTPALTGLTMDVEQLWGIRNGTVFGKSLRVEADVDLGPFLEERAENVDDQALKRHVKWIVDRQPLTLDAFWRLIRRELP
jgi:hypothetical protein